MTKYNYFRGTRKRYTMRIYICSCQKTYDDTKLVTAKRFHGSTDPICIRLLIFLRFTPVY